MRARARTHQKGVNPTR